MNKSERICFVIAPIGEKDSEARKRSDQVLKLIIGPAAKECGYTALRADKISQPGQITHQVISHILNDPLVVVDLTGHNPNVFYELAIRHASGKPIVQMIDGSETLPFDTLVTRTIFYDHSEWESPKVAQQELVRHIRAAEKVARSDNPIAEALDMEMLRTSPKRLERQMALALRALSMLLKNTNPRGSKPTHTVARLVRMPNDGLHLTSTITGRQWIMKPSTSVIDISERGELNAAGRRPRNYWDSKTLRPRAFEEQVHLSGDPQVDSLPS